MNTKIDLSRLQAYEEDGLLRSQTHPEFKNLSIFNYSQKAQYERVWDDITLQCRGLVVDTDAGEIVARPFKKFFNIEEEKHIPTKDFKVYEKMDGSLGIAFYYNGQIIFASRGSFTSDQAIKGRELLEKNPLGHFDRHSTYLFEIIYPENRIVVDYEEKERLVLLGRIGTKSGMEYSLDAQRKSYNDVVPEYRGIQDYTKLKQKVHDNAEGFIIKFSNGDRCKIKGEEYIRLHRIMTEVSTKTVWECLSEGRDLYEVLEDVPDEFFNKIEEYANELKREYALLEEHYKIVYGLLIPDLHHFKHQRAYFAERAKQYDYPQILFKMLDKKDYSPTIWKILKPEFRKL